MGKAARKKINKKKQFYKDPKVEESETPVSKELLYGVEKLLGFLTYSSIVQIQRFELARVERLVLFLVMFSLIYNSQIPWRASTKQIWI